MKRKKIDVKKEVKAIARERVGSPKPGRAIEPKQKAQKPKHKKPLLPVDQAEWDSRSGSGE